MTLRRMQEDLREAKKDLAICQTCVTCLYDGHAPEELPCRVCIHQDPTAGQSWWRWRRDE